MFNKGNKSAVEKLIKAQDMQKTYILYTLCTTKCYLSVDFPLNFLSHHIVTVRVKTLSELHSHDRL